jgi:hypothetical protein
MEHIRVVLDDKLFDEAVHGKPEGQPSLPECGDLAIYVKKNALQSGMAAAVVTFNVVINGCKRRVQCVTTVTNLINAGLIMKGWREGDHLNEPK